MICLCEQAQLCKEDINKKLVGERERESMCIQQSYFSEALLGTPRYTLSASVCVGNAGRVACS